MSSGTRRWDARRYALLAGALLAAFTVALRYLAFAPYGYSTLYVVIELWLLAGAFFLAAVPTYALIRYRIVTPLVVTVGLYAYATVVAYVRAANADRVSESLSAAPLLLDLYLWVWFVPLTVGLVVGGGEYLVQRFLGLRPVGSESDSRS